MAASLLYPASYQKINVPISAEAREDNLATTRVFSCSTKSWTKGHCYYIFLSIVSVVVVLFGSFWKVAPPSSKEALNLLPNNINEVAHVLLPANTSHNSNDDHYLYHRRTQINHALRDLQRTIDGAIYFAVDDEDDYAFSTAAHVWSERSVIQEGAPWAVIEVLNEADVQKVVPVLADLKRTFEFDFRVKSGGHNKAGFSTVPNGAVISLARLNHVELTHPHNDSGVPTIMYSSKSHQRTSDAIVRMGPAVLVEQFVAQVLKTHGYGGVIGFCGTVAEGGFVLGGGIGLQSRLYGLGLDNVAGLRIVLADGSAHYVSNHAEGEEEEQTKKGRSTSNLNKDLFWALRGAGGGNFGVVTEIDYHVHKANDKCLYYNLLLQEPNDMASFLYQLGSVEEELPGNLLVMHDFVDGVGLMWSGRDEAALYGSADYLDDLIDRLVPDNAPRKIEKTEFFWSEMYTSNQFDGMKTPNTWAAGCWYGFLMPANNTEAIWQDIIHLISEKVEAMSPFLLPDIELWGGAIHDIPSNATAFPHRSAVYNVGVLLTIAADTPNAEEIFQESVSDINIWWPRISQYLTGSYVNYPMASIEKLDYPRMYWGDNLKRLVDIKRRVDPHDVFSFPLSVPMSLK